MLPSPGSKNGQTEALIGSADETVGHRDRTRLATKGVTSPTTPTPAADWSTSTEVLTPRQKTPGSYGEVPGSVLARVPSEQNPKSKPSRAKIKTSLQWRSRPTVRVSLEKKFNTMCVDNQVTSGLRSHDESPVGASSPHRFDVFNLCGQVTGHNPSVVHPDLNPFLISSKFHLDEVGTKPGGTSGNRTPEEKAHVEDAVQPADHRTTGKLHVSPTTACCCGSGLESSTRQQCLSVRLYRDEVSECRKKIGLCCEQRNKTVSVCTCDTTHQRAAAFLTYISRVDGDEGLQERNGDEERVRLKSESSSDRDLTLDRSLRVGFSAEQ